MSRTAILIWLLLAPCLYVPSDRHAEAEPAGERQPAASRHEALRLVGEADRLRAALLTTIKAASYEREPGELIPMQQALLRLTAAQDNLELVLGRLDGGSPQRQDELRELTESLAGLKETMAKARSVLPAEAQP